MYTTERITKLTKRIKVIPFAGDCDNQIYYLLEVIKIRQPKYYQIEQVNEPSAQFFTPLDDFCANGDRFN